MKRILVIQKLISLGKIGGSVTIPVFSSMFLEPVFVPVWLKPVSFNESESIDLYGNLKSYSESFRKEMIHFDAIFYDACELTDNKQQLESFIIDCKSNDSFIILNNCNSKLVDLSIYVNLLITKAFNFADFSFNTERSKEEFENFIREKCKNKCTKIVVLDYPVSSDRNAIVVYDDISDKIDWIYYKSFTLNQEMQGIYDLFVAIISASVVNGIDIKKSIIFALNIINKSIEETVLRDNYNFYCLDYEKKISELSKFVSDNSDIFN